jgi:hypothetical protein
MKTKQIPLKTYLRFISLAFIVCIISHSSGATNCNCYGDNFKISSVSNSCHAKYEVLATIRIDSTWGNRRSYSYSVLKASPFDTSLFANDTGYLGSASNKSWLDSSNVRYDTVGLFRHVIDTSGYYTTPTFVKGDTLRDIFLLQAICTDGKSFSIITRKRCCLLVDSIPPFPVKNALSAFNVFLNSNNIPKGNAYGINNTAPLKLGPIYSDHQGDCGWSLSAYYDTDFWYFTQSSEYGDCPAGCSEGWTALYRVSLSGFVERLSCSGSGLICPSVSINYVKQEPVKQMKGILSIYDLRGRLIIKKDAGNSVDIKSLCAQLKLKPGIYIVKPAGEYAPGLRQLISY